MILGAPGAGGVAAVPPPSRRRAEAPDRMGPRWGGVEPARVPSSAKPHRGGSVSATAAADEGAARLGAILGEWGGPLCVELCTGPRHVSTPKAECKGAYRVAA
mmetsp:Transcript_26144/g.66382  ORF Transcript_26144/g.66382 Transcript_26144/m.66382 type:complete len:103 (+) Transcript_26144:1521-1829(+)